MKRVHGYDLSQEQEPSGTNAQQRHAAAESDRKRRGSATLVSTCMKRTSSSQARGQAATATYAREGRHGSSASRHVSQLTSNRLNQLPLVGLVDSYTVPMEQVSFSRHSQARATHGVYRARY